MSKDVILLSLLLILNRFFFDCSDVAIDEFEQVNVSWGYS